jgi:hypothetical protein
MFRVLKIIFGCWRSVCVFLQKNNAAAAAATLCILLHDLFSLSFSLSSFSAIDDNSNNSMNLGV